MTTLSDSISRTALALINSGAADSIEAAQAQLADENINIVAGPDACSSEAGQAAILTATTTATRAVGRVHVVLTRPEQPVLRGLHRGQLLSAAVTSFGARLQTPGEGPVLVVGTATGPDPSAEYGNRPVLTVTWSGWTAAVRADGSRLAETGNQILAPITAAALAVHDAWAFHRGRPDGARRPVTLPLWDTTNTRDSGPTVNWLPQAWHLVGLGHLGQAYAWTLGLLPYNFTASGSSNPLVVLQDTDIVTKANQSTGVLLTAADIAQLKTRVTAPRLEVAGFTTRIIEHRITRQTRRDDSDPSLALIGVDNPDTRQIISNVGWELAVDVGLGGGAMNYTGISLHTITGQRRSDEVLSWQTPPDRLTSPALPDLPPAYSNAAQNGHDTCGLVQLAGRSVAASFVGVVAACIAIAEPLRLLAGQPLTASAAYDLRDLRARRAVSANDSIAIASVRAAEETATNTHGM